MFIKIKNATFRVDEIIFIFLSTNKIQVHLDHHRAHPKNRCGITYKDEKEAQKEFDKISDILTAIKE